MKYPQSARTAFRFANPLAGGDASSPAKPVLRRLLDKTVRITSGDKFSTNMPLAQ